MTQFSQLVDWIRLGDEWRSITGKHFSLKGSRNFENAKRLSESQKTRLRLIAKAMENIAESMKGS